MRNLLIKRNEGEANYDIDFQCHIKKLFGSLMDKVNNTAVEEFILLAFSDLNQLQIPLFFVVLFVYIICMFGNFVIIILVIAEPSLHTPMYLFICELAVLEIMFVSCIVPNLLANLIADKKSISFSGCFIQLFANTALGTAECYLLAVMAFDRDLAINKPLHYSAIMTQELCVQLILLPWIVGIITVSISTVFTAKLEFCGTNEINHFICDYYPLQSLACSNTFITQVVTNFGAFVAAVVPFTVTVGLYTHVIIVILKINSAESKQKAYSTLSSHLTVAGLFYITAIVVYIVPKGTHYNKFLALIYTVITPLLNPFIYAFRNKDIKKTLIKSRRLKLCQGSFQY
ncbi:olfactory receptor 2G3-like [Xenopus laevis]|uniref:Olfactory receptor 2G3-like n=2 Tax=Xenopus laevis TaxID=8355 RepID=A0A8J1LKU2_XENLA|nr:olfactory receptor 2G3-like [Xenopus laevis]